MAEKKKKRPSGPLSAAGLVSFYEDLESAVKLNPTQVFLFALIFAAAVLAIRLVLG